MQTRTWTGSIALALGLAVGACQDKAADPPPPTQAASQAGTAGTVARFDADAIDDLLVGAPFAEGAGTLGAVFVYQGSASGFSQTPTWTLTGGDNFGGQLANVGDLDGDGVADFAVAALNGDGPDASLSGAVTVYKGGSGGQVLRTLGGEQALDKFGTSLLGCDVNADGRKDLVVGAPSHSPGPDRYLGGAYYVYFGPGLSDASRVKMPATLHTGILGFSSACGDLDGDGHEDLVTAAIWTHGVIWHASKVLVHYGKAGFAPDADAADVTIHSTKGHFGDALAVLDDLDGDGSRELAIGLPEFYAIPTPSTANPMTTLKGRVFVVKGGAGARTINLSPPVGTPMPPDLLTSITGGDYLERFGSSIEPLGDLDGDGKPDFAVSSPHGSAPGATSLATGLSSGKVWVFRGKDLPVDGAATTATAIGAPLARAERTLHFGTFLATFQQGGATRLLVGAPTANRQAGQVFVEDPASATTPAP